jgi:hypothetical protein
MTPCYCKIGSAQGLLEAREIGTDSDSPMMSAKSKSKPSHPADNVGVIISSTGLSKGTDVGMHK